MGEQEGYTTSKQTSEKKREYEVGTKKSERAAAPAVTRGPPFTKGVNWPVDDKWHTPPQDFIDATGITTYKVGHSKNIIYDYYIEITTNQDYNYGFTDEESDTYHLNVVDIKDDHLVRYNSDKPTIIYVSGE